MASHPDGTLREFIRYNFKVHPTGLDAALFYIYNRTLLGKVPSVEA